MEFNYCLKIVNVVQTAINFYICNHLQEKQFRIMVFNNNEILFIGQVNEVSSNYQTNKDYNCRKEPRFIAYNLGQFNKSENTLLPIINGNLNENIFI